MTNKLYDTLKLIALNILPPIGALYFALSEIWGLPYAAQIVGTISAIGTCVGAIVTVSKQRYDDMTEVLEAAPHAVSVHMEGDDQNG